MANQINRRINIMRPQLPKASELLPYLEQIDASGIYTNMGPLTKAFEARLASHFGVAQNNIVTTSNCTAALHTALLSQKRNGAKYCLLPSWTFAATAHAVIAAGLTPYFVDVEEANLQLSLAHVLRALHKLGGQNIGAVMLVAPFGAPVSVEPWEGFQKEFNIPVILDAAAAFDTVTSSELTTCVSLPATKMMTAGEGGFIILPEDQDPTVSRARTNFGFWKSREAQFIGGNAKMSEYHAAVGLASLDQWKTKRKKLQEICAAYFKELQHFEFMEFQNGFGTKWFSNTLQIRLHGYNVDAFKLHLDDHDIDTRRWWKNGCHRMTAFSSFPKTQLETTELLAETTISLPLHTHMSGTDIAKISSCIASFANSGQKLAS
jgi:dTDP-4-amino-4,6-dideoxygalactose transaminase